MAQPTTKMRMSLQEFMDRSSRSDLANDGLPPWQGSIVSECLRPGFHIFMVDLRGSMDLEISTEFTDTAIGLALALEGNSRQTVSGSSERVSGLEIKAGNNMAAVCRPEKTCLHLPGGSRHRIVKLQIDADAINTLLDVHETQIPEVLRPVFVPSGTWRADVQTPLSPNLEYLGFQMLNHPFSGAARRLFLEGKALEILAEQLRQAEGAPATRKRNVSREDLERLELARSILEKEYGDPPTILALARRIGLNDFKLKRDFKEIYDTTVFGYVRKLRMEKARALLESGTHSVTEVALETGHSCLGHFAASFKREFGVVPSRYRAGYRNAGRAT